MNTDKLMEKTLKEVKITEKQMEERDRDKNHRKLESKNEGRK